MPTKSATTFTAKSTASSYVDWRDRQHKARQQGPQEDTRQALFDSLNLYCQSHHCWIISVPLARRVTIEAPLGSNVAADLAAMGFKISGVIGSGSRFAPNVRQENLETNRYMPERLASCGGFIDTATYEIILPRAWYEPKPKT